MSDAGRGAANAARTTSADDAHVDLYWLPLGAGGRFVRANGRLFEAVVARHEKRPVCDLYHSALEIQVADARFVVEMTPAWGSDVADRGVACQGAVGARWLGRSRYFRYEVRRWRDGVIPDLAEAVDSPRRVSTDIGQAQQLLDLVPAFPTEIWGRDHLGTGDMWNSNSLTSWLLASVDLDLEQIRPPRGGRAPGWNAGVAVAHRCSPPPTVRHRPLSVG
jgi:hypothetical protein